MVYLFDNLSIEDITDLGEGRNFFAENWKSKTYTIPTNFTEKINSTENSEYFHNYI